MIQQTSFLGMPLRTQGQRRLLVILYYGFFLSFSVLALVKNHGRFGYLFPQIFTFGGLLGGIKIGGPVKVYSETMLPVNGNSGVQTLNLEGRKPFDDGMSFHPLDERERLQRDFAHYTAYRILRWSFGVACVAYWLSLSWGEAWIGSKGPILAGISLVYVLSLPQAVLLWTEPDQPSGELRPVPHLAR
jgi:hypothetical protein